MTDPFYHAKGIILRVIPFRDYDQIVTLFTVEKGLLKLICKKSRSQKKKFQGLCTPLTEVEVIYHQSRGEIDFCQDMQLIQPYRFLRDQLSYLETGCELLRLLYSALLVEKPAPALYELLKLFLQRIPKAKDPWILVSTFRLKLLKHEGILVFPLHCEVCQKALIQEAYYVHGDLFCEEHRPCSSHLFEEELALLQSLTQASSLNELCQITLNSHFHNQVTLFFREHMRKN